MGCVQQQEETAVLLVALGAVDVTLSDELDSKSPGNACVVV